MTGHASRAHTSRTQLAAHRALPARRIAADILGGVLRQQASARRAARSRASSARCPSATARWCARIVATVLRRLGTLAASARPSCSSAACRARRRRSRAILLIGAAQILFLDVPDHAAVDLSVRLAQADRHAARYSGLVNAVLRRLARDGKTRLAALDAVPLDTPEWLMQRWIAHYGEDTARAIAVGARAASRRSISRSRAIREAWAATLNGRALPTGTVRTRRIGPVSQLARLRRRRMVGAGRRRGACRRGCSATCAASPSPISAPRPAARPRSSRTPARGSPRSTARRRGSSGCGRT